MAEKKESFVDKVRSFIKKYPFVVALGAAAAGAIGGATGQELFINVASCLGLGG